MIEWYTLLILLLLGLLDWLFGADIIHSLNSWFAIGGTIWAVILALLIYLAGLPLFAWVCQFSGWTAQLAAEAADQREPLFDGMQSFDQPIHGAVALVLVAGSVWATATPPAQPGAHGLLTAGATILLAIWVRQYWAQMHGPLPASLLRCEASCHAIRVVWSLPNDPRITGVRLFRMLPSSVPPDPYSMGAPLYEGGLTSYNDVNVAPDMTYLYWLFTIDLHGRFAAVSSQQVATLAPPKPPVDLRYIATRNAIALSWHLVEPDTVHTIRILRRRMPSGERDAEYTIDGTCEAWHDGGLPSGTIFAYTVSTIDRDGQVASAELARAATLVAPARVTARVVQRNRVELSWQVANDLPDFQGITITRAKAGSHEPPEEIHRGTGQSYTDPTLAQEGLEFATSYCYIVEARYTDPIRSEPAVVEIQTEPAPAGLQDITVDSTRHSFTLRWRLPREMPKLIHITAEWFDGAQNKFHREEFDCPGSETSYTISGAQPSQSYSFTLSVQSSDGHWSQLQQVKQAAAPPPAPPSQLQATWSSPNGPLTLTWQPPAEPDLAKIQIVRRTDRRPETLSDGQVVAESAVSPWIDSNATPGQKYYYGVFSCDSAGHASAPAVATVRTHTKWKVRISIPDLKYDGQYPISSDTSLATIVATLLSINGVDLEQVIDWSLLIVETGADLSNTANLLDAGYQSGQSLLLMFSLEQPAAAADSASMVQGAAETVARSPTAATVEPPPERMITLNVRIGAEPQSRALRARTTLTSQGLVSTLLYQQGVDLSTVTDWQLTVEGQQHALEPDMCLGDAGLPDQASLLLTYTQADTEDPAPSDAAPTAPATTPPQQDQEDTQ